MGSDQSVQHRVATPLLQLPGQLRGEREVARPGEGRPMFYHTLSVSVGSDITQREGKARKGRGWRGGMMPAAAFLWQQANKIESFYENFRYH